MARGADGGVQGGRQRPGLPRLWLKNVFQFAPAPAAVWRVPETSAAVSRRTAPAESFLEFSLSQLRGGPAFWDTEEIRRGFHYHLEQLAARGKCKTAGEAP